jgi:hypothetical protein
MTAPLQVGTAFSLVVSDEATLRTHDVVDRHNCRICGRENPQA